MTDEQREHIKRGGHGLQFWRQPVSLSFTHEEILTALRESVKLQSHYAKLLNMYDGGQRLEFPTAEEWMARLRYLKQQQNKRIKQN